MKLELELVRAGIAPPEDPAPMGPGAQHERRALRLATERLLQDGLRANTLDPLLALSADLMLIVASTVDHHGIEPDVPDFIEAATALIEDGRAVLDKGLTINSAETAKCGAVMLELTVRGIYTALGQDYEAALRAAAARLLAPPTGGVTV